MQHSPPTDPLAIIPIYSSNAFSDGGRLVYCLLVHPIILEFVLYRLRQGGTPVYNAGLRRLGLSIHEPALFSGQTNVTFAVEAILVLNRRFMLGQVNFDRRATIRLPAAVANLLC